MIVYCEKMEKSVVWYDVEDFYHEKMIVDCQDVDVIVDHEKIEIH